METGGNRGDLVLPNDSYAHVLDETKGHITCYVGPSKTQLAETDKLVVFDPQSKKYRSTERHEAVKSINVAPEGWYIILKNPAVDRKQPPPSSSDSIAIDRLDVGRKIHIPGPISFALWPGQMSRVVQGHHLRTNQYLIVRVYDAEAAKENWGETIIQKTSVADTAPVKSEGEGSQSQGTGDEASGDSVQEQVTETKIDTTVIEETGDSILDDDIDFTVGKLMIVKGTDVSFFIPPTGIEVVKDSAGKYTREAVTLERLFYCILLDESGSKRYIRGPAVVFPQPSEIFQTHKKNGITTRKFRAVELNDISGIYVKVIAPYSEGGRDYKEGEELFITGKEQSIYYRRDEHQIIRYGDQEIHYATAIPKGEARYMLNRLSGEIITVKGPNMLLPDPRTEVIVRRLLPNSLCELMYPGNTEAQQYNSALTGMMESPTDFVTDNDYARSASHDDELGGNFHSRGGDVYATSMTRGMDLESFGSKSPLHRELLQASANSAGMEDGGVLEKKSHYTKPRTITLSSKYDGAVCMKVWTGYAVMIVNGVGERKVVEGPATYNLAYDEYPEVVQMSTGKPKNTDRLLKDIYLRTKNNKISDIITVETKDLVQVSMKLSYRLNFTGDKAKWFDVENYVKFLCDHMRSKLKGFAQTISLSEFYGDSVNRIRSVVLGEAKEGECRSHTFDENGMCVTDVEVLKVTINDDRIADDILSTQREIVTATIGASRKTELLALKKQIDALEAEEATLKETALDREVDLHKKQIETLKEKDTADHERDMELITHSHLESKKRMDNDNAVAETRLGNEIKRQKKATDGELANQENLDKIAGAELAREAAQNQMAIEYKTSKVEVKKLLIAAQSGATVEQMKAVSPNLVAALQDSTQISVLEKVLPAALPLSIVEGKSANEVLGTLFAGTSVGQVLGNMTDKVTSDKK